MTSPSSPPRPERYDMTTDQKTHPTLALAAGLAFIATVLAANWAIGHLGTAPQFPGAPHTINVGFGWSAPSGVLFVSLALVVRDLFQYALGWRRGSLRLALAMLALIGVGAALSYGVSAANVATASALAFAFSELADYLIFTLIAPRWGRAVLAGGIAGAVVDSWIFLMVAFGSLHFIQGQILGKAYGVILAAGVIAARRVYLPNRVAIA